GSANAEAVNETSAAAAPRSEVVRSIGRAILQDGNRRQQVLSRVLPRRACTGLQTATPVFRLEVQHRTAARLAIADDAGAHRELSGRPRDIDADLERIGA